MKIHPLSCGLGLGFLLELPQGLYLIDSGSPGEQGVVLAKMKALGRRDLKLIWITHAHYDHYGSAAALRTQTGAQIGVHPADAQTMLAGLSPVGTSRAYGFLHAMLLPLVMRLKPLPPTIPDFTLTDGETLERFGLDASILHTPGHTPGHTCVLVGNVAFAADLLASVPWKGPQFLLATDWSQLPNSLRRLQSAHPERIYTGHSRRPMAGEVLQKISYRVG